MGSITVRKTLCFLNKKRSIIALESTDIDQNTELKIPPWTRLAAKRATLLVLKATSGVLTHQLKQINNSTVHKWNFTIPESVYKNYESKNGKQAI